MVTDDFDVYETTKIKPLCSELRHRTIATGAILGSGGSSSTRERGWVLPSQSKMLGIGQLMEVKF
jgi:hypothetical protein